MIIRKAKKKDIPHLIKMTQGNKSIEDYPGEYDQKLFENMLKDRKTIVLVVEFKEGLAGFYEFKIDQDSKRISGESLVVAKEYRNKGIGSALFSAMEDYAKKLKIKRISFIVRRWNKPMNSLAIRKGYKLSDKFNFFEKEIR